MMGGAEKQAIILADYMKNTLHYEVEVWAIDRPEKGVAILDKAGITWRICNIDRYAGKLSRVKQLLKLIKEIRSFKPDVIMPYTYWPNVLTCAVWKYTGAKTCIWNQRDEGRGITGHLLEKVALKNTPVFVSNSEEGRLFLSRHLKKPKDEIKLIHNAVTLPSVACNPYQWREKAGVTEKQFVACMLANLHGYKDHKTLIDAWKIVYDKRRQQHPVLLLAGRLDHSYESLKRQAEDNGIGSYVKFLGGVDDVAGILSITHLSVFSSRFEGCPNGVLESMKAGLPIVATSIIGIREALGDNYAYLTEPSDVHDMANKIIELMDSPELRIEIGKENESRVNKLFSSEQMTRDYKLLLDTLLD